MSVSGFNPVLKSRQRQEIERQVLDYINKGGEIKEIKQPRREARPISSIGTELRYSIER